MTDPRPGADTWLRLVFEYQGEDIQLVAQTPVDIAPTRPPRDPEAPGDFVEVRTEAEEPLGRAAVAQPIGIGAEVFPENHSDAIVRSDLPTPRGAFTVVIPAPAAADHVSVVRVGPVEGTATTRSAPPAPGAPPPGPERVELGSFRLLPR